jgi:replicative superfamily II helicase
MVKVKKKGGLREGRGYSIGEILEAGLTLQDARRMKLRIDRRRKSVHPFNVSELKSKKVKEKKAKKPKKEKVISLSEVKGIGPKTIEKLGKAGIRSANDLLNADLEKISAKTGISIKVLTKYTDEARKVV